MVKSKLTLKDLEFIKKKTILTKKSFNKLIMKKISILSCSIVISVTILLLSIYIMVNEFIIMPAKVEAKNQSYIAQIKNYEINEKNYKQEYSEVIKIRDKYRTSIKELLELLYNKDMSYIGGNTDLEVKDTDQVTLLNIQQVIQSMNDDQQLMMQMKDYLVVRRQFIDSFPFAWPIAGDGLSHISSSFGLRDLKEMGINKNGYNMHEGIDIVSDRGTPIIATANGIVTETGQNFTFGKYVIIKHEYEFETKYCHLDSIVVLKNQKVNRGQKIGTLGNTGDTTGPHLHYEIKQRGVYIDPLMLFTTNY
jgi:murein DD-endopeptidase MepM/ murein hydrolase activator NlpD